MAYPKTDITIVYRDSNEDDNVCMLTMCKARKLYHSTIAEIFAKAFIAYDETYPKEFLEMMAWRDICRKFISMYSIKFKEDFYYLIRHPELTKSPDYMPNKRTIRLYFDCSDEDQRAACEYLENIKPRQRIAPVKDIMRQMLIREADEYWLEQNALRLMRDLQEKNGTDSEIAFETQRMIDLIWEIGLNMHQ